MNIVNIIHRALPCMLAVGLYAGIEAGCDAPRHRYAVAQQSSVSPVQVPKLDLQIVPIKVGVMQRSGDLLTVGSVFLVCVSSWDDTVAKLAREQKRRQGE